MPKRRKGRDDDSGVEELTFDFPVSAPRDRKREEKVVEPEAQPLDRGSGAASEALVDELIAQQKRAEARKQKRQAGQWIDDPWGDDLPGEGGKEDAWEKLWLKEAEAPPSKAFPPRTGIDLGQLPDPGPPAGQAVEISAGQDGRPRTEAKRVPGSPGGTGGEARESPGPEIDLGFSGDRESWRGPEWDDIAIAPPPSAGQATTSGETDHDREEASDGEGGVDEAVSESESESEDDDEALVPSEEGGVAGRLLAFFVDFVLVVSATALLLLVARATYGWEAVRGLDGDELLSVELAAFPLAVTLFVVAATYFTVSHALFGQTLGSGLFRLRVVDGSLDAVSWKRALLRFALSCVTWICFPWVLFDRRRQALHDKLAGTLVLRDESV